MMTAKVDVGNYDYPLPQFHTHEDYFHALEEMAELRSRRKQLS